jgi:hypothetical protein
VKNDKLPLPHKSHHTTSLTTVTPHPRAPTSPTAKVCPWYTNTPLAAPVLQDAHKLASLLERTPMGRIGEVLERVEERREMWSYFYYVLRGEEF